MTPRAIAAALAHLARNGIRGNYVVTRGRATWHSDAGSALRIEAVALDELRRALEAVGVEAMVGVDGVTWVEAAEVQKAA